jgi:putative thioredoxin
MVDEFTGALPERQVRDFIERLMPSPAEPLRQAAAEARHHGDSAAALELLKRAVTTDPKCESAYLDLAEMLLDSGALDDARGALEAVAATEDPKRRLRAEALAARLLLAANAEGADVPALQAKLAENPADLDTRLQLGNALALHHDYRGACEHLLEIVRRDRKWNDEAGRKTLLALFNLLSADARFDDLVREFRVGLARTLN